MKNLLFVVAVFAVTLFSGCNKDDDSKIDSPLNGTTWKHVESGSINGVWTETSLIMFKETTFEITVTREETSGSTTSGYKGTYTYVSPNLNMEAEGKKIVGLIDGSKLRFDGVLFIKQLMETNY